MGPLVRAAVEGAGAGAVATVPMSAVMLVAQRRGDMGTQPPERVAEEALGHAGLDDTSEGSQNLAASLAHLAFGAGGGASFALLRRRLDLPLPAAAQGAVFGLGVWALSYQGWIPALGILPPADDDRPDRQLTMIVAHLVYGSVLGAVNGGLGASRWVWRKGGAG